MSTDIETLAGKVLSLQEQRERAVQQHELRSREFAMGSECFSPREYSDARAAVDQAADSVTRLTSGLRESQTALDAARNQERLEMEKQQALANVHVVMNRLQITKAELDAKHQAARDAQNAIITLTAQHSNLLAAVSAARDKAAALGAT